VTPGIILPSQHLPFEPADGFLLVATMMIGLTDMKANNYEVADAGESITFKGVVARSVSQAFFLVFVTAMSMATLALVLNIQFNDLGR